jgi:chromosome segregation ATPase
VEREFRTEGDALASWVDLAEPEIEKLRVATTSAEEAAERARTATATTKAAALDAAQAAAREKAALETKVVDLEHDLGTAMVDLAIACRQFSQVTNQLQEVYEEVTRLRESNTKLMEDLEGKSSRRFPSSLLVVNSFIKVRLDLQADKSPVVVKGPFFPRVVNPRYRIRGTNV